MFKATNGVEWLNGDGWLNKSRAHCSWFGVTCTAGNVVALRLSRNNLIGTIPEHISYLSHLELFSVEGNPLIAGELPSGFGNLVSRALQYCTTFTWIVQIQLQQIDCAFCRFTGSIPTSFGKLKELTSLKLQNNELLYAFPDELSQLSKLHTLWLQNNQLTFLPDSVQELTALVSFKIASNRIAGVPHHTCWTRAFNPAVPPQALCQIWGVFMLALILLINMDSSVLRRWTSVTIRSEAPSILWLSNWSTSER